jgi:hypothetical protein
MMIRIGKALQGANFNLINSQIFGATPAPSSSQASVSGPKQPGGFASGPKAKAWNDVYSAYFNPDGSVIDTQTYDTPQKIQDLLDKLNAEFKQKYPNMTL